MNNRLTRRRFRLCRADKVFIGVFALLMALAAADGLTDGALDQAYKAHVRPWLMGSPFR